ncbi:MAG: hypothetical protein FWG44_04435 [Oscillospiraceae bacterium]|nr:hypothetical protein [Oscillospiraceae bacterium]
MSKDREKHAIKKAKREEARRELALQEAKRKRTMIAVIVLVAVCVIAFAVFLFTQQSSEREHLNDSRIFEYGGQTITLYSDNTFTANLSHGAFYSGTYNETPLDEFSLISFKTADDEVGGSIYNDVLTIPEEWDDGHGHGTEFALKK